MDYNTIMLPRLPTDSAHALFLYSSSITRSEEIILPFSLLLFCIFAQSPMAQFTFFCVFY